ncbi:MAG TPA: DUF6526 family protein [Chitinophagaceae bacterium]|nr:DUF6526 family protein [Chitinophagaceae bacterium]
MSEQNFKSHSRYLFLWHFILPLLMAAAIAFSVINFRHSDRDARDLHELMPMIIIPIVMLFIWYFARSFALRAQDRAIRAEENFRHFILTGKPFDNRLRMSQIIALRFASDEEMPALAKRAIDENLSQKQIKQDIKNWRSDHNRV